MTINPNVISSRINPLARPALDALAAREATARVPRHLWNRTIHRLIVIAARPMPYEQHIRYVQRYEAVSNVRRGTV